MTDAAEDYAARAEANRPTDPAEIRREVMRLRREGLKPRDIAEALKLSVPEVLMMIYGSV